MNNILIDNYKCHYKIQAIVNTSGVPLGHEVLIDFHRTGIDMDSISEDNINNIFHHSVKSLLRRLALFINENPFYFKKGHQIFINVERKSLCDTSVLSNLISLNQFTKYFGLTLVVEVTERNNDCTHLPIINGLKHLKKANVILAIDDYNIYDFDFRSEEITQGYYDYIKVMAPKNDEQVRQLNGCSFPKHSLIIEQVETVNWLANVTSSIWGLQGYYFDKGRSIPL